MGMGEMGGCETKKERVISLFTASFIHLLLYMDGK